MFDLPKLVAKLRFKYHSNALDVNNVLNQLGFISNGEAEERNKKHAMELFTDIMPRIYGQETMDRVMNNKKES